jgi:hypothetical protein
MIETSFCPRRGIPQAHRHLLPPQGVAAASSKLADRTKNLIPTDKRILCTHLTFLTAYWLRSHVPEAAEELFDASNVGGPTFAPSRGARPSFGARGRDRVRARISTGSPWSTANL